MKFKIAGKIVEVNDEVIAKAIEDKTEELDVTTDLIVRTPDEERTFVNNTRSEAKNTGIEVAVKEVKKELGLDFTGKDIKDLVKAAGEKAVEEAKLNPDKAVEKLKGDVETLKNTITTLTTEKQNAENGLKSYRNTIEIDRAIESALPDKLAIDRDDAKILLKSKMRFDVDDAGRVITMNEAGEVMKSSTTADPLPVKDVLDDYFRTNPKYITGPGAGNGGGDSGSGGGKVKFSEYLKAKKDEGADTASAEFTAEVAKKSAAGEIDMDN